MRTGWWRTCVVMVVLGCGAPVGASAACAASPLSLSPLGGAVAATSEGAGPSGSSPAGVAQPSLSTLDRLLREGRYALALETIETLDPALRGAPEFILRAASAHIGRGEYEDALKRLDLLQPDKLSGQTRVAWLIERGNVEVELDQLREGRVRFDQARDLATQSQWPSLEARARLNGLRAQIDDRDIAGITDQIASIRSLLERIPAPDDRARLSISLAELTRRTVQELSGDEALRGDAVALRGDAFALLTDARARASDPGTQGFAAGLIGALYEDEGRLAEALAYTQQARFLAQQTRAREQLYRWEWQSGRILRAQGNAEASRAAYDRAVKELNQVKTNFPLGSRGTFQRLIAPVYSEYAEVMLRHAGSIADEKERRDVLVDVRKALETLKEAEVQDYFGNACVVRRTAVENTQLRANAVIVYPVLLADRLDVLVEENNRITQYTMPVGRNQVTERIRQLRALIESDTSVAGTGEGDGYLAPAQDLYRWLLSPMESVLRSGKVKTLVIVPDGALRTIPLSVLHDGRQFLVERFALATTPAIALTESAAAPREGQVLMGGLTEARQGFRALPNVDREMKTISGMYPGTLLENADFQLSAVEQALAVPEVSIAHFATHGEFNRDHRKSFILTYDSQLTMNGLQTLLQQRGPDGRLDLLVLSACRTAAGDDRAALGLAGVAIQSGVESAVASLWYISDAATAELVSRFYQALKSGGETKAESLRRAQMELIRSERFGHPSYWAPYLLIGNWL